MESLRVLDQDDTTPSNMDFEARLLGLEYLIMELLIKNQQLRDRLHERGLDLNGHRCETSSVARATPS
jgi:hypothetical protein